MALVFLQRALRALFSTQFILFLVCSGTAAAVNLGSRIGFSFWIGSYAVAIIMAYLCGMGVAFTLNKFLTFRGESKNQIRYEIVGFIAVNLLGLAQTLVVSLVLVRLCLPAFGIHRRIYFIAHLVGVAFPMVTSFVGHKYITFGRYSVNALVGALLRVLRRSRQSPHL